MQPSDLAVVQLYTLHQNVDRKWRFHLYLDFTVSMIPTANLKPLAGFASSTNEHHHIIFLRDEDNIVGFKFVSDGFMWHAVKSYKLDLYPVGPAAGIDVHKFRAVALGPRVIPMEKVYGIIGAQKFIKSAQEKEKHYKNIMSSSFNGQKSSPNVGGVCD